MFWNANEDRMQKALTRFRNKYALGDEANAILDDLKNWLSDQQAKQVAWSYDAWIRVLMGSDQFDKESVSNDLKRELQALEAFSTTLVSKLATLHAALTAEQREQIADEFEKYEQVQKQWYGWGRRDRLRHQEVA